jgi:hypothetical protein
MNDYGEMFYGTLPPDTQDFRQVLSGIGKMLRDRALAAGERIGQSGQEAIALQNQIFGDPNRPLRVTDENALRRYTDMIMGGPLGFAPVGMTKPATQAAGLLQDVSYKGSHTAPNANVYGATLDDLTKIMPKDVYSQEGKRLYGIGDRLTDSEWYTAALRAKGNPDAEVTIYRAVPKGVKDINASDWVTTSQNYAKWHGENALDGQYEIIKKKVKAKTLSTEGYPYEFGYNP